ncbi:MAG: hypothetical protein IT370_35715 [Deltaproteobacteria bacterium]|nr:hypothetical protein [Deltaproteobacteria bacterium]
MTPATKITLLSACLTVVLAGCGNSEAEPGDVDAGASAADAAATTDATSVDPGPNDPALLGRWGFPGALEFEFNADGSTRELVNGQVTLQGTWHTAAGRLIRRGSAQRFTEAYGVTGDRLFLNRGRAVGAANGLFATWRFDRSIENLDSQGNVTALVDPGVLDLTLRMDGTASSVETLGPLPLVLGQGTWQIVGAGAALEVELAIGGDTTLMQFRLDGDTPAGLAVDRIITP